MDCQSHNWIEVLEVIRVDPRRNEGGQRVARTRVGDPGPAPVRGVTGAGPGQSSRVHRGGTGAVTEGWPG